MIYTKKKEKTIINEIQTKNIAYMIKKRRGIPYVYQNRVILGKKNQNK